MTTIAVNKYGMAGDQQYSHSGGMTFRGGSKIMLVPSDYSIEYYDTPKMIMGICGDADSMAAVWEYVFDSNRPSKIPKFKNSEIIALTADGKITTTLNLHTWLIVKEPFYAVGSGMRYAMAAMDSGKTPLEAVKIASKYDMYTGKGFNEIKL